MAKNNVECLVASAIWSREDPLFPVHRQLEVDPPFNIYYKCDSMLFLKGWHLINEMNCCTAVTGITYIGSYFPQRTAVLSRIRTRVILTDPKLYVC